MIGLKEYYWCTLITLMCFAMSYMLLREIIWSIAMCNTNKRTRRSDEFKSKRNISMSYLSEYITRFKKQYYFWMKVKRVYVISQAIWLPIYLSIPLFTGELIWSCVFNMAQSIIPAILFLAQFDTDRCTKYDRYRRERKMSR